MKSTVHKIATAVWIAIKLVLVVVLVLWLTGREISGWVFYAVIIAQGAASGVMMLTRPPKDQR